jgi:hypothetical protein
MKTRYAIAALTLTAAAGLLFAGPLNPPPGSVASTYKTLQEVEPRLAINSTNTPGALGSMYKITQPGSYYLTGNINANYFNNAIEIASSDVTLDLSGFALEGAGATSAPSGVIITAPVTNVTIRNGTARGWPNFGFKLDQAINVRAIDLTASNNGAAGIALGTNSTAQRCQATYNGTSGISTVHAANLSSCTVSHNVGDGMTLGDQFTVTGCNSESNSGSGFHATGPGVFNSCTATTNTLSGFLYDGTLKGGVVTACTANSNTQSGFTLLEGATITDSSATGNGTIGIAAGYNCLVSHCSAYNNTSHGISAASSLIEHNICTHNGQNTSGAGIFLYGTESRVEDNHMAFGHYGLFAGGSENTIVRNTCTGNSVSWSIAISNYFGPIVDRTSVAVPAVSGNSAASSLGVNDANANITD